jgi:hypothetical protein
MTTGSKRGGIWWTRQICSIVWALVPLGSFGVLAPLVLAVAPLRVRSRLSVVLGVLGVAIWASAFAVELTTRENSAPNGIGVGALVLLGCAATGYGFTVRNAVFGFDEDDQRRAIASASLELHHRDQARKIATRNPRLADELHIGRPDLANQFDDGGLVDANHAPLSALTGLGMSSDLAQKIVTTRERVGGFDSLDDLEINLELSPQSMDHYSDVLIFLK